MTIDLINLFEKHKLDYGPVLKSIHTKNLDSKRMFDISVIVPVRGRKEFLKPVLSHLENAALKTGLDISITYVEHSVLSEYLHPVNSSFIWIPCNNDSKFNKCLCFNIGVIAGPKAQYYLFYDADLICRDDFFENIVDNISPFMQTFKGRRVLYAGRGLTDKIVTHGVLYDEFLNDKHPDITIGNPGAPGGSILVSRDLFFKVGGYDDCFFFVYSVEDQFFFNKCLLFEELKTLSETDLVHLWHGDEHQRCEDFHLRILEKWIAIGDGDRKEFVKLRSGYFNKYKN